MELFKKKKMTAVADAIAPLQKIANDLRTVATHHRDKIDELKEVIIALEAQSKSSDFEATLAELKVSKMEEVFDISPEVLKD